MDFSPFHKKVYIGYSAFVSKNTMYKWNRISTLVHILQNSKKLILKQHINIYVFTDPKVLNNIYSHKNWQLILLIVLEKKSRSLSMLPKNLANIMSDTWMQKNSIIFEHHKGILSSSRNFQNILIFFSNKKNRLCQLTQVH